MATNLEILCGHRGLAASGQAPFDGAASRYGAGIYLTDGGRARLAQIQGYLSGLAHAGQMEYAERLATDLMQSLRYLNQYGGTEETKWGVLPRYRVRMDLDSAPLSFHLTWLVRDDEPERAAGAALNEHYSPFLVTKWTDDQGECAFYFRNQFSGGLLFHGPGGAPGAVTLTQDPLWSVHT